MPMYETSRLDTEVAVRCFDFRWFVSERTNAETGRNFCSLHVPASWLERGWVRFNFDPERGELPRGTLWPPEEKYEPFHEWGACVGKEGRGQYEWGKLPPFSLDWKACGMVIEWLHDQHVTFTFKNNKILYVQNGCRLSIEGWDNLKEAFCLLAIDVAKHKKIDFPDSE